MFFSCLLLYMKVNHRFSKVSAPFHGTAPVFLRLFIFLASIQRMQFFLPLFPSLSLHFSRLVKCILRISEMPIGQKLTIVPKNSFMDFHNHSPVKEAVDAHEWICRNNRFFWPIGFSQIYRIFVLTTSALFTADACTRYVLDCYKSFFPVLK